LGISLKYLKVQWPGSGIPGNGDARMGRTRQTGIQKGVVKEEGADAHQQGGLFPAEAMDPTLGLGPADARPGPVFSLVKVPVRGSSPFEYGIGSILVHHGFEASVHPAGFFFQNGTADLQAGGSKSFQTSALDQGMGIGAGEDHRSNSRCKDGLRAGRGSALMIAGFQADKERGGRSSSFTELVILEVGLPGLKRINFGMGQAAGLVKTLRNDPVVQRNQGSYQGVGRDPRSGGYGQFQTATNKWPVRWQRGEHHGIAKISSSA
jgi:hypothetical protein